MIRVKRATTPPELGPKMPEGPLNKDQERRVGTHLSLLIQDLAALEGLPELRETSPAYQRTRALTVEIRRRAEEMRDALALPPDHVPSLKRRVAAVAEVWAAHLQDLRPKGLRAYGHVRPDVERLVDPHLSGILDLLKQLVDAANALPED